jgi:hypothetical protein
MLESETAVAEDVWDDYCKKTITRCSSLTGKPETLDKGVNFFVEALEAAGAIPRFSCEGHPKGFYVMFLGDYELALRLLKCRYFKVEVEGTNYWSIRLQLTTRAHLARKNQVLRAAAESWVKNGIAPVATGGWFVRSRSSG